MTATAGAIARQTDLQTVYDDVYTPVLTAAGSALGVDGYLTGKWWRTANHVSGIADLLISGVGSVIAGTSWRLTLPFNADLSFHVAGTLNSTADIIGHYQTHSSVSGDAIAGSILLSATAEMIFYRTGSTASLGSAQFTGTTARIKAWFSYVADPALF